MIPPDDSETLREQCKVQIERLENSMRQRGQTPPTRSVAAAHKKLDKNAEIMHMLLLDPMYQLPPDGHLFPLSSKAAATQDLLREAFWKAAEDALKTPTYAPLLAIIDEIRGGLVDLAPPPRRAAIESAFDVPHLEERIRRGAFDMGTLASLTDAAYAFVREIQTPARAAKTRLARGPSWRRLGAGTVGKDRPCLRSNAPCSTPGPARRA